MTFKDFITFRWMAGVRTHTIGYPAFGIAVLDFIGLAPSMGTAFYAGVIILMLGTIRDTAALRA